MPPPGMVTYPGYQSAYPNTGCRGAYWARKPIFNADGLLIGYTHTIIVSTVVLTTRAGNLFALQI